MSASDLSTLGEYGLIERIRALLPPAPSALVVGIGDDAAVWRPTPGQDLVLTTDCMVEERHCPTLTSLPLPRVRDVGHRAAHMNLSDLAAMAARPRFALVSLALPDHVTLEIVTALYKGMTQALTNHQTTVAGGNITSTSGPLHLTIMLGGEVDPDHAALRTGSQPGDWIGCTGTPGLSAAGLHAWLHPDQTPWPQGPPQPWPAETPSSPWHALCGAYFRPAARLSEAQLLRPHIHAMTDISDGLLLDLHNILGDKLGAIVEPQRLPRSPAMYALTQHLERPPTAFSYAASDDYELLFTASPAAAQRLSQQWPSWSDTPLHWFGTVQDTPGLLELRPNGSLAPLHPEGWQHFQSSP